MTRLYEMERTLASQPSENLINNLPSIITNLKSFQFELQSTESEVKERLKATDDLCTEGADILSPDEFHNLRRHRDQLRDVYNTLEVRSDTMLDRANVGSELERQFNHECTVFKIWMADTDSKISAVMSDSGDPRQLQRCRERAQIITDDVVSHSGDLQSIQSRATQLRDELQGYIDELNKAKQSQSPPMPLAQYRDVEIKEKVDKITDEYQRLARRCDELHNLQSAVESLAQKYHGKLADARNWISEMESETTSSINRPVNADPSEIDYHLEGVRTLTTRLVNEQGVLVETRTTGSEYLVAIEETEQHWTQKQQMEEACDDLDRRHGDTKEKVSVHSNQLQLLLTQSQGVITGIDDLLIWLNNTEIQLSLSKPLPLVDEKLREQSSEQQMMLADIESRRSALEQLEISLQQLLTSSPASASAGLPEKIAEMSKRYDIAHRKCKSWGDNINDTQSKLNAFLYDMIQIDYWLTNCFQMLSNSDSDSIGPVIDRLRIESAQKATDFGQLRNELNNLLSFPNVTETEPVKNRLSTAEAKWNQLQSLLVTRQQEMEERKLVQENLKQRIAECEQKVGNYKDGYGSLQKWLENTEELVDNQRLPSTDHKVVKAQLDEQKLLQKLMDEKQPTIRDFANLGAQVEESLSDDEEKDRVRKNVNDVTDRYGNLCRKVLAREDRLQEALGLAEQWTDNMQPVESWLDSTEKRVQQIANVANDEEKLKEQIDKQHLLSSEIDSQRPQFDSLLEICPQLMGLVSPQDSKDLQTHLADVTSRYDQLGRSTDEIGDLLNRSLIDAREKEIEERRRLEEDQKQQKWDKYNDTLRELQIWLDDTQEVVANQKPPSTDHKVVKALLDEQKLVQKLIDDKQPSISNFDNLGLQLEESLSDNEEKEKVRGERNDVTERYDNLCRDAQNRKIRLQEALELAEQWTDNMQPLESWLDSTAKRAQQLENIPTNEKKLKEQLDQQQKLAAEIDSQRQLFDSLVEICPQIMALVSPQDAKELETHLAQVTKRYEELGTSTKQIGDLLTEMEEGIQKFFGNSDKLAGYLDDAELQLSDSKLLPLVDEKLKEVSSEQQAMLADIENRQSALEQLQNSVHQLLTSSPVSTNAGLPEKIAEMTKRYDIARHKCISLGDNINDTQSKLGQFENNMDQTDSWLTNSFQTLEEPDADSIGPVIDRLRIESAQRATDFGQLKNELNNLLSVPNVTETEPVKNRLSNAEESRNQLQSLLGTRQQEIEERKRLEEEQKQKLAQSEQKMDNYKGDLRWLQKWLEGTEELVANQRPPSTDHKVVKAQLDEQNLLQKLMDDKQPTINDFVSLGEQVEDSLQDGDRKDNVRSEINDVTARYDNLCREAQNRQECLQEALELAERWTDSMQPLESWLDSTEKRVQQFGNVPTDEEKLQEQIEQQQNLASEIDAQRPHFDSLVEMCPQLMALVSPQDAEDLENHLTDVTNRYDRLGMSTQEISGLLSEMVEGIQNFFGNTEELAIWLDDAELKLAQFDPLSVFPIDLQEQSAGVMTLAEEIAAKQDVVSDVVTEGRELCKHTTGDEAVSLQGRLEGFRLRFGELSKRTDTKLGQLEEALPLAENYHSGHEKIEQFLTAAESDLSHIEDLSMENQDELIRNMEEDVGLFRVDLENLNSYGGRLGQLSPGEGASTIESMSMQLNRRFDAVCEQVQRRAERLDMAKKRSLEVFNDMDDLSDWFREAENRMASAGAASADPEIVRQQVRDQRLLNGDIAAQKTRVRDLIAAGKKLTRDMDTEDAQTVQDKIDALKEVCDNVSQLSVDRLSVLEEALPLAELFNESVGELNDWLTVMEPEIENSPAVIPGIQPDQLKRQKSHNQGLLDAIQSHKPIVDKFEKTGTALAGLCTDEDADRIKETMENISGRYASLRENTRDREMALDEAVQESSQFSDKLDLLLDNLTATADQVRNADPVASRPDKLRDQIEDNCALMEQLEHKSSAFQTVKDAANDIIAKAQPNDPAIKEIGDKLAKLDGLWDEIQKGTDSRGRTLGDTLAAAEIFWDELQKCMEAVQDLKKRLESTQAPACEPHAVQMQQEELMAVETELHDTVPRIDLCKEAGQRLLLLVGAPEKPEIEQEMGQLDDSWNTVTGLFHQRHNDLIEAMERAMVFHDLLRGLMEWLEGAEVQVASWPPVTSITLDQIHQELQILEEFRKEVENRAVEKEQLVQACNELIDNGTPEQTSALRKPLQNLNNRWERLNAALNDRQQRLERALLEMGHFQQAYDQLIDWIGKSDHTLDEIKPAPGDLRQTEIELAKHKVLENDIGAHQASVDTLNSAGQRMIDSGTEAPEATQQKLEVLNDKWGDLHRKLADKLAQLESCKGEAETFGGQVEKWMLWLDDMDKDINSSKPTGGLPETARQQLDDFGVIEREIEEKKPEVESMLAAGNDYITNSPDNANSVIAERIKNLGHKWDQVQTKANDKKKKLEIALRDAEQFHKMITDFNDWLSLAEQTLNGLDPVSRLLEPIANQMEDHNIFQGEVTTERDVANDLQTRGTKLQYYCEKKDAIPIKNLLVSAKHRFDKVVSRTADRTRHLDLGFNEATEFFESWKELCEWLDENNEWLHGQQEQTASNPEKIKEQLNRHKEFQRELGSRQPHYDQTAKLGKILKDHAPKTEQPLVQEMLDTLRNKWNGLCNGAVDRQRNLEEALLLSGQFKEAVAALLEWLEKVEPTLAEDLPVDGDLETVSGLVDQHKNFQTELKGRATNVETVRKAADELLQSGDSESQFEIQEQMAQLDSKWENVGKLSDIRHDRLDEAYKEAEKFYKGANTLLEWLAEMETKLKFAGALPDTQEELDEQLEKLETIKDEFDGNKFKLDSTLDLGRAIQEKCHPNAVQPMKRWLTILQSRWDEVSAWANQREDRLKDQLQSLKDQDTLIDDLLKWMTEKEIVLNEAEQKPDPEILEEVEKLIEEHQNFEVDLRTRQGDVDDATKGRKPTDQQPDTKGAKGAKKPQQRKPKHPKAQKLSDRWRQLWLQSMERQRKLNDLLAYLKELKRLEAFSWDQWRNRYMDWHNNKKSRVMDFFRRQDRTGDGKIGRDAFIDGILSSKFPTTRLEMNKVADLFDRGDGLIDYREFIAALRPERLSNQTPKTDVEKIEDEVQRQVHMCTCINKFPIRHVGEGKYRFGEGQKMRLVRILRSTVMVRVGGGWEALDEFLVKNDPCRAKGRTNVELREKFILAEGVTQGMHAFRSVGRSPVPNGSHAAASTSSGSVGSPRFHSTPGPVMKVREKTERSVPMSRSSKTGSSVASASSSYLSPDSEVSSITSRRHSDLSAADRFKGRSVAGSQGSRPSSRGAPSPRPPSRTGSDISDASGTPTRIPSLRGKKGVTYKQPWK